MKMAYSDTQWEKAMGYYEAGLSLAKIKDKTGIARNTISQRAKKEQWEHGKNSDYIEAKEIIAIKKGTEKEQSIICADEIADERTKHLIYFQNSALRNQQIANKALEEMEKEPKPQDRLYAAATHATTTAKNKETVLGKEAAGTTVNVQNNNTAVVGVKTLNDFYEEQ